MIDEKSTFLKLEKITFCYFKYLSNSRNPEYKTSLKLGEKYNVLFVISFSF